MFFVSNRNPKATLLFEPHCSCRGRHGRDYMVVGLITTKTVSAYHH